MKKIAYYSLVVILSLICVTSLGYVILYEYSLKLERDDLDKVRQKKQVVEERQEQVQDLEEVTEEQPELILDEEMMVYKKSLEEVNSGILYAIGDRKLFKDQQEVLKQYKELLDETDKNVLLAIQNAETKELKDEYLNKYKTLIRDTNRSFLDEIEKSKTEEEQQEILSRYRQTLAEINNELPKSYTRVPTIDQTGEEITENLNNLYSENSDLVGWISIDGTVIDYPVMETPDEPLFYEHHDWNKNYTTSGLPFVDAQCNNDSENTIIYGHNMKSGAMFGGLKNYKNKDYYYQHPIIKYDTLTQKGEYEIIGVVLAKVYYNNDQKPGDFVFYNYAELDTQERFDEYMNYVKSLSLYDTGKTAQYGDKLITLCTCHYHVTDGRILVIARKIN